MRMFTNSLLFVAALALSLAPAGCVMIADTVSSGDPVDAHLSLSWDTLDARSGLAVDCYAVGADMVSVVAYNMSRGYSDAPTDFVDLFDCREGFGVTTLTAAGEYRVGVNLLRCGTDEECWLNPAIAGTSLGGAPPIARWITESGVYDIGHFDFYVDSAAVVSAPSEGGEPTPAP